MDPQRTFKEALAAQQGGDLERAERLYRKVVGVSPSMAEIHNNLSHVLNAQGKHKGAIAYFRRALALKPDHAKAYNNLGNAFSDQERHEEAIDSYERALKLEPGYASAHTNLRLGTSTPGRGLGQAGVGCSVGGAGLALGHER